MTSTHGQGSYEYVIIKIQCFLILNLVALVYILILLIKTYTFGQEVWSLNLPHFIDLLPQKRKKKKGKEYGYGNIEWSKDENLIIH